jgi:hypothetical protein
VSRRSSSAAAAALGGAAVLALLTGCAGLEDILDGGRQEPRTVTYECAGDREFVGRFSADREEIRVWADDEEYELQLTGRENGRRVYSDDDNAVRLTVGGDEAYLRIPGEADFRDCEARR